MWKTASPYNNLPGLPPPFRETAKIFRQTTQHVYDRRHPEIRSTLNDLSMICVFFRQVAGHLSMLSTDDRKYIHGCSNIRHITGIMSNI